MSKKIIKRTYKYGIAFIAGILMSLLGIQWNMLEFWLIAIPLTILLAKLGR